MREDTEIPVEESGNLSLKTEGHFRFLSRATSCVRKAFEDPM